MIELRAREGEERSRTLNAFEACVVELREREAEIDGDATIETIQLTINFLPDGEVRAILFTKQCGRRARRKPDKNLTG